MNFLKLWLFYLLGVSQVLAQDYISIQGYFGKEQRESFTQQAEEIIKHNEPLIIRLNTSSGDLEEILKFSRQLYLWKKEKHVKLIVYLEDVVVGPGAIIPLLADKMDSSFFLSWGDITYGVENALSINILKNQVLNLVEKDRPHAELLQNLAEAMIDKNVQWNSTNESLLAGSKAEKEALVLNSEQLINLKLIDKPLTWGKFKEIYHLQKTDFRINKTSQPYEKFSQFIKYDPHGPNSIGWITIDDRQSGINQSTALYVKSALEYYQKNKPIFIVLELNTPGGEVYAAQKISDALKNMDTQFNIPIVAYINNWAISAGAMLAYSSRYITVVKDASMGAAEPVIAQQTGEMKEASEKVNSALRADFANRASFFDRNPFIAEAMVDKDILLVLRHGKVIKLDSEDQILKKGADPDLIISKKGKLLTLNAEQLIQYGVADLLVVPSKTELLSQEERGKGQWPAKYSQLFHAPFFKDIPQAVINEYQMDWKTRFFAILAHPMVSSMLFLGLMLGLYMEISNPGLTLPGTVAAFCLFFIVLSSFAQEIGNVLELILLFTGVLLLLVEIFILPSFGLVGIFGIIFFLGGLLALMLPGIGSISYEFDTQTFNAAGEAFLERLGWLSLTIVLGGILIALLSRYLAPSLNLWNRFVLQGNEQEAKEGYLAGINPSNFPVKGTKGKVLATLRPAGKVIIEHQIYDAISNGGFIEKEEEIEVIGYDSSSVVVKWIKTS